MSHSIDALLLYSQNSAELQESFFANYLSSENKTTARMECIINTKTNIDAVLCSFMYKLIDFVIVYV